MTEGILETGAPQTEQPKKLSFRENLYQAGEEIDRLSQRDATWGDALKIGAITGLIASTCSGVAAVGVEEAPFLGEQWGVVQKAITELSKVPASESTGKMMEKVTEVMRVGVRVPIEVASRTYLEMLRLRTEDINPTAEKLAHLTGYTGFVSTALSVSAIAMETMVKEAAEKPVKKGLKVSTWVGPAVAKLCKFMGTNPQKI